MDKDAFIGTIARDPIPLNSHTARGMTCQTLIDAHTLAQHLGEQRWAIFDCRFSLPQPQRGLVAYQESHIPGAVYADLDKDLASAKSSSNGRHPLPDPQTFTDWLGASGVDNTTQVVAYDDAGGAIAARLWWLLRWLGHAQVAVLDGGWQAWTDGGFPVTADIPPVIKRRFDGKPDAGSWLTSEQVAQSMSSMRLLDARAAPRFTGEKETIDPVAGHIPGALNSPFDRSLDASGRFLPADALRERFTAMLGDVKSPNVVHMCGSGVTACHNLLAMEHAGLTGSRLYVGSWSEWITDPKRPVATGYAD